ncbi:putative RDD family membrane protein YckC [Lysobacter enzymogenes]|uniref:RDD family protein n=1 Tax=Lysobacter enzymogenes TaxID=69 RepID=UPI0033995837
MSAPGAASPPAGFWPRYAAWSLDAAIVAALVTALGIGAWRERLAALDQAYAGFNARMAEAMSAAALDDLDFGSLAGRFGADPQTHAAAVALLSALTALTLGWLLAYAAFGLVYETVFVAFTPWRATPGKRALGLYVIARDGGALGPARTVLRYLAGTLSWLTLNIGHLLAAARPEHQALHDRVAGASVRGPARMPLWAWAWLVLQMAAALAACMWLMWTLQAGLENALYGGAL